MSVIIIRECGSKVTLRSQRKDYIFLQIKESPLVSLRITLVATRKVGQIVALPLLTMAV